MKNSLFVILICVTNSFFISVSTGSDFQPGTGQFSGDFQVNDILGGYRRQSPSSVAMDSQGNFVVVCEEYDETQNGNNVYFQRYSSDGSKLGQKIKANTGATEWQQTMPIIAMNDSGNFVIAWHNQLNYQSGIYGQCFYRDGTAMGVNFKVNTDGNPGIFSLSLAIDHPGNFWIVWTDEGDGAMDIYGQSFNTNGDRQGGNIKISQNASNFKDNPSIAVDQNGNFMVVWIESEYDNYGQILGNNGQKKGENFLIFDGKENWPPVNSSPVMVPDCNHSLTVAWYSTQNSDRGLFCQRFSSDGIVQESTFLVNNALDENYVSNASPLLFLDRNHHFCQFLPVEHSGNYVDIYGYCFNQEGQPIGSGFVVNEGSSAFSGVWAATSLNGRSVVVWLDERYGYGEMVIFGQQLGENGTLLGSNFMIADDGSTIQTEPALAANENGDFVIVWEGDRNRSYDIYGQRYQKNGERVGGNFKINTLSAADEVSHRKPAVAMDRAGNFMVVWQNYQNGDWHILGQFYNFDGSVLTQNFKVNDDTTEANNHFDPAITFDQQGNFLVVWQDARDGYVHIYGQYYNREGLAVGPNFRITNSESISFSAAIAADAAGNLIMTWSDRRNGKEAIYCQRYRYGCYPVGEEIIVANTFTSPAIAANKNGDFVVAWFDGQIFFQRYDQTGEPQGVPSPVDSNYWVHHDPFEPPAIAMDDNGNFAIVWAFAENNISGICSQRFDSLGNPLTRVYPVNTRQGRAHEVLPFVTVENNRMYYAWAAYDIFARVDAFNTAAVPPEQHPAGMVKAFQLEQNYPNPFNPVTRIAYQLEKSGRVELRLFNVSGQQVQTLVSGFQNAGRHEVILNGEKLGSGVYYYQLRVNDASESRKCLLLK